MSTDRIRDRCDTSDRARRIKVGDLVVVNGEFIDETYYEQLKNFTGIVTDLVSPNMTPDLVEVLWTDGAMEKMYEDELDKV
jgi:hypothetical protein